ncbi:hypothetical protein ACFV90_36700 [Streptomyces sp. NPDC059904]|uniref:hypothetical protein n=1 Tax=Streptomyces sp. NPDC059904 TaxID=3346996 RepID=UPI0036549337
MIIVYTPADGEPEQFDANSLKVSEASIVSRAIDMKWAEIKEALANDDIDAMRGVAWVIKKRAQPSLRFGEFDPGVDEMTTRFDKAEATRVIDNAFDMIAEQDDPESDAVHKALAGLVEACADREHAQSLIDARTAAGPKEPDASSEPDQLSEPTPGPSETPTSAPSETSTSDSSPTSATSPLAMSTT